MRTIIIDGVEYRLTPVNKTEPTHAPAPAPRNHDWFRVVDAAQRRAEGDPAWKMTDAQWIEYWKKEGKHNG